MCTEKMRALSFLGVEKITFPLNLTDGRTDISNYRVASLLKIRLISTDFKIRDLKN